MKTKSLNIDNKNVDDKSDFTQGSIIKKLILFMIPILGALILQAAYGAVDLLVVGKFGSTAGLSGVSTGSQVLNLVTFVVTQFSAGITILIGIFLGEKREKRIGRLIGASTIIFTIILVVLLIGIDLTQKLYKNSITSGISRAEFYLSKFLVLATLIVLQLILTYSSFIPATLINGMGTAPKHFLSNFLITIGVQFICTLAWVSLVSFVLYATNSIIAAIFTYLIGVSLLSLPTAFYPDIDWLKYLNMQFYFDMVSKQDMIFKTITIALLITLLFAFSGLQVFKRKDL